MFNKKGYKKFAISILASTMILGTIAFAAEGIYNKQVTATYGRIKFNYEGSDVTSQIETKYDTPAFTVDGRGYAPVRAMADLLGVDIDYDHKTHTAKITDPKIQEYKLKLNEKDKEIAKLEKELKELKKEVKEEEKKEEVIKEDLKSVEKTLNTKYGDYENVKFNIVLKENKDNITIDINVDLTNTRDEQYWIRMRNTEKRYLIEDIVSTVRKTFTNMDITGNIYDSYTRKDLYTFSQGKGGSLSISNRDYIGDGYYDNRYDERLDSYIERKFNDYGITGARLYASNYGRWDEYFEISFSDTTKNKEAWNVLNPSQLKALLNSVATEIEYEYNYGNDYIELDIKRGTTRLGTYDRYGNFRQK